MTDPLSPKSKIPSVRALERLKDNYRPSCNNVDYEQMSKLQADLNEQRRAIAKKTLEWLRTVLNNRDIPWYVENKKACDWNATKIENDGSITIKLIFDPSKHPDTKGIQKQIDSITGKRTNAISQLERWFTEGLFKIANREQVERFEIKKD
jgi:hypothetical protein